MNVNLALLNAPFHEKIKEKIDDLQEKLGEKITKIEIYFKRKGCNDLGKTKMLTHEGIQAY